VGEEAARQFPATPVALDLPDALPSSADPVRFAEIVRQLLENACRYSPSEEPVLLKARTMSEGVVVSVTDHGEGIQREIVTKAFNEPFSTGEEILRKQRAGAGVGLHMARQLVLQHGGIMWADPLPAGGTRVSFVIPAKAGATISEPLALADPEPIYGIPAALEGAATAPGTSAIDVAASPSS
jgi:two-component system, OmpR family, sensor histidine kinase KdpD